ncbi:hypothetical protein SUDANB6_00249 [Streptomyces sp. enrichment culture]|uniref:hypothetical protein n=1 Tax=Streptomyces sp. enrichment culture TaxID=1795815 RepID=UPI003F546E75
MASTFEELVAKRRAADQAHQRVEELRHSYGPPTQSQWTSQQSHTYETAVRAWRDLDRDTQAAVTEYAKERGQARDMVEEKVREAARGAEPS